MTSSKHTDVLPPVDWDVPPPTQLPLLRDRLVQQMENPYEYENQLDLQRQGRGTFMPDANDPAWSARTLMADERARLAGAALWTVTDEMTALSVHAGEQIPKGWEFRREDLPLYDPKHPTRIKPGFMIYEVPIGGYVGEGAGRRQQISIVGASWGPTVFSPDNLNMWLTFWAVSDVKALGEFYRTEMRRQNGIRLSRDEAMNWARANRAELSWDNEAYLAFNTSNFLADKGDGKPREIIPGKASHLQETTMPWVQTVRATWLLMKRGKQATVEEAHQSKQQRRAAERSGYDPSPVRVVHLHSDRRVVRPKGEGTERKGGKHSVRYPVTGHWRDQYYASRDANERIWIDEHDRGVENEEYRIGKTYTVRVLDRPPR